MCYRNDPRMEANTWNATEHIHMQCLTSFARSTTHHLKFGRIHCALLLVRFQTKRKPFPRGILQRRSIGLATVRSRPVNPNIWSALCGVSNSHDWMGMAVGRLVDVYTSM